MTDLLNFFNPSTAAIIVLSAVASIGKLIFFIWLLCRFNDLVDAVETIAINTTDTPTTKTRVNKSRKNANQP